MRTTLCGLLVLLLYVGGALCWDQEELDLFDLVEEIEENFYDILGVEQTASASEVKRAYRQLSLKLHPDKSDDPDAADKFRKLVAVAEVLKDEQKREWYDRILVEGLPDWKQPLFYYRRVRKMGLLELSVLVLVIATVGHYLFGWAVYLEKQLVLQELLGRKQKKERKTRKSTKTISSQLEAELEYHTTQANASIPSMRKLLPVVLAKGCLSLARFSWSAYSQWKETLSKKKEEESESSPKEEEEVEKESEEEEIEEKPVPRRRSGRKRVQDDHTERKVEGRDNVVSTSAVVNGEVYESGSYEDQLEAIMNDIEDDSYSSKSKKKNHTTKTSAKPSVAMETSKKASVSREESSLRENKDAANVTQQRNTAISVKENESLVTMPTDHAPSDSRNVTRNSVHQHSRTPLAEVEPSLNDSWSQYQQTQLEWALTQYPKFSKDRWENISKAVPGKSMDECVSRCKVLFEAVRRRRGDGVET